jgi:hypothetical protein
MSSTRGDNRTGVLSVKKKYPDPRTLPAQPSWQQSRPQLTLSELTPGQDSMFQLPPESHMSRPLKELIP